MPTNDTGNSPDLDFDEFFSDIEVEGEKFQQQQTEPASTSISDLAAQADALDTTANATPEKDGGGGIVSGIASGAVTGAAKAVDNTVQTAFDLGGAAGNAAVGLLPDGIEEGVRRNAAALTSVFQRFNIVSDDGEGIGTRDNLETVVRSTGIHTPEGSVSAKLAEGLTQFAVGFAGGGRVLSGVKASTTKGKIALGAGKGAFADFFTSDPNEARLSNLLRDHTPLSGPVLDFLAQDEGDDVFESRIATVLEGGILGVFADTVIIGVKALKAGRKAAAAPEGPAKEAAQREANELEDQAAEAWEAAQGRIAEGDIATRAGAEVVDDGASLATRQAARAAAREETAKRATVEVSDETTQRVIGDYADRLRQVRESGDVDEVLGGYNPARDLNFDKFDSPDSFRVLAKAVADATGDVAPTRTIDSIQAEAADLAKTIGGTGDDLVANVSRLVDSPEQLPAVLTFLRTSHQSALRNLAEASATSASADDVARAAQHVIAIQQQLKGVTSNVARALRTLREPTGDAGEDFTARLLKEENPDVIRALDPTGRSSNAKEAFDKFQNRVNRAGGDPRALSEVFQLSFFRKVERVAEQTFTASILSAPGTFTVNTLGGLIVNVMQPFERALAGIGAGDRELAREGLDQFISTWSSSMDALRLASRAFKTGRPVLDVGNRGSALSADFNAGGISAKALGAENVPVLSSFLNGLETASQGVHRFILFGDEFNRQIAFQGRVKAAAMRSGRDQGLTGAELAEHVHKQVVASVDDTGAAFTAQRLDNFTSESAILRGQGDNAGADAIDSQIARGQQSVANGSEQALQDARLTVFQEGFERGTFSSSAESFVRWLPFSRIFIAPFIRTPVGIIKNIVRRTPVANLALADVREALAQGGEAAALARARVATGSGLYTVGAGMAMAGMVTGAGPRDKEDLKALRASGWQPYSIRVGDKYYSYNRFDPVAGPIGIMATGFERGAEHSDDGGIDLGEMADLAFTAIVKGLGDKSYLQGVTDFIGLLEESDPSQTESKINRFFGSKASGFVPNILAVSNPDDVLREAHSIFDHFDRRIPGRSETLDARRNVLGETVKRGAGLPSDLFNVSRVTTQDDPVLNEIARETIASNSSLSGNPKTKNGIDLTKVRSPVTGKTARDRWGEIMSEVIDPKTGHTLRSSLEELIASPEYAVMSTGTRASKLRGDRLTAIGEQISAFRKLAFEQLVEETPELSEAFDARSFQQELLSEEALEQDPAEVGQSRAVGDFIDLYRGN